MLKHDISSHTNRDRSSTHNLRKICLQIHICMYLKHRIAYASNGIGKTITNHNAIGKFTNVTFVYVRMSTMLTHADI